MMNGFETEIRQRIIDTTAHITVYSYAGEGFDNWKSLAEKVNAVPDVVATAPNIFYKSVIGSGDANDGVFVKGIDPNYEFEVSKLRENIVAGEINLEETEDSLPGIVIGRELAGILECEAWRRSRIGIIETEEDDADASAEVQEVRCHRDFRDWDE